MWPADEKMPTTALDIDFEHVEGQNFPKNIVYFSLSTLQALI